MEEKYKYVFFYYLYNKLNLKTIELEFEKNGIIPTDFEFNNVYKKISKYFSLVNKVDDSRLTEELKNKYHNYFSLSVEELLDKERQNEIFQFLESTYKLMLFPNINEKHCFYGPLNDNYMAPRDSVVLGFNYYEFDIPNENFDEIYDMREEFICEVLNYIQITLSQKIGMTIAVIKYNEYVKKKVR